MSKGKIKLNPNGTIDLDSIKNMKLSTFVGKCIEMGVFPTLKFKNKIEFVHFSITEQGTIMMTNLEGFVSGTIQYESAGAPKPFTSKN